MTNEPLTVRLNSGAVPEPFDRGVAVPWWSFTKTVLAAAALRLVGEGRLALDEAIADRPYSLRHLLQHTAGVPDYGAHPAYQSAVASGETPWTAEELIARVDGDHQLFEPGRGWSYSNIGYLHVRRLIENAVDDTIDIALRHLVFDRIDLDDTRVVSGPTELAATAWGDAAHYHPGWVFHGLLVGTARDAVMFLDALMSGAIVPRKILQEMTASYPIGGELQGRPWRTTGYGLGLMIGEMDGVGLAIGHSGVGPDSVSAVYHLPQLDPPRTVAAFSPGPDEGENEYQAISVAV